MSLASAKIFKSLKRIVEDTGCVLNREQKSNLIYAFTKIGPQCIEELSITLLLGLQTKSAHEIADKYVEVRERGEQVSFPYSKLKGIDEVLAKTFGLILYREQASLLINELMQNVGENVSSADFMNWERFMESLKAEYKNKLSDREKNAIYFGLLTYSGFDLNSYEWCLNIAKLIKEETAKENS